MTADKTPQYIKLDERNHVGKPLLDQRRGSRMSEVRSTND
jgi:hypothetical protein